MTLVKNNIQLSFNGVCPGGTSPEAAKFGDEILGSSAMVEAKPTSFEVPFQLVIRQKGVAGDSQNAIQNATGGNGTGTAVGDNNALELANLVNAWFNYHASGELGGATEITAIYIHITYKQDIA